jgi:hypothetical protein
MLGLLFFAVDWSSPSLITKILLGDLKITQLFNKSPTLHITQSFINIYRRCLTQSIQRHMTWKWHERKWSWAIWCTVPYQKRLSWGEIWTLESFYKRPECEIMHLYTALSSLLYVWRTYLIVPNCQRGGLPLSAVHTRFHNTFTATLSVMDAPSSLHLAVSDDSHQMTISQSVTHHMNLV